MKCFDNVPLCIVVYKLERAQLVFENSGTKVTKRNYKHLLNLLQKIATKQVKTADEKKQFADDICVLLAFIAKVAKDNGTSITECLNLSKFRQ